MQNDNRLNRIFAFFVFIVSTFVYLRTIAPTTSFWDCGEFITCAYILGVPHPPGAPLYLLIGRIFSMIPFAQDIGLRVNVISSLASGFTVMFTYLIIVRLMEMFRGKPKDIYDRIIVYGGGILGSLAFAFTDSFWFNSVEAEVYSISMFFTALVFWLILVWHEKADDPGSDRYILLIAYVIGLAIGVHLLNILALPAVFLVIYFRKYKKLDMKNFLIFASVSMLVFITIYPGIVKYIPNLALKLNTSFGTTFTLVFFIVMLLFLFLGIKKAITDKKHVLFLSLSSILVILVAVSTYTTIYLRSNLNPAIDENDPENIENMVSYLNREQYGDWSIVERRAPLWEYQIKKMYIRYFGWQFIGKGQTLGEDGRIVETISPYGLFALPFLIGLIGMFHHFRKDWKHASTVLVLFVMTGLAIVIYLNQENPQPRERDYVYVGSFFAFALWIGIGAAAILDYVREKLKQVAARPLKLSGMVAVLLILALALPINLLAFNYHTHNRTKNYVAYDYSYNILQSCEPNAILFTNGDNDTFPLWFLQYVYGIRKDVRVVNLSLLNTHWYIKQLRDEEPRVPISLNDFQIDNLTPKEWGTKARTVRFKVPKETYLQDMADVVDKKMLLQDVETVPEIVFEMRPTMYNRFVRVQDLMILNIIRTTQFRKPIYFALTVSRDNQIDLNKYLRMDGLVFKLVTYPNEFISPAHLRENLFNKFRYRGLNDPTIYYNENIKGLLRNYQGSFFSLAQYYIREKMYDDMTQVLDKLFTIMPDTVIPMRPELQSQFAIMYFQANQPEKSRQVMYRLIKRDDLPLNDILKYAGYYVQLYPEDAGTAVQVIESLRREHPNYANAVYWLANYYLREKQYQTGIDILDEWMIRNPSDENAIAQKAQLMKMLESSTPDSATLDSAKTGSSKG